MGIAVERAKSLQEREMVEAIKARDVVRVRQLLEQDEALVNARGDGGQSALLLSVYHGAKGVTQLLLQRGVETDVFEAAALGDAARVRELVRSSPDVVKQYSRDGWTPLHLAAFFGHFHAAQVLLESGAEVSAFSRNDHENTPLHAALAGRRFDVAKLLLAYRATVKVGDAAGWTPLHHAADAGEREMVLMLLKQGADVNARSKDGETPLTLALRKGCGDVAAMLREHGGTE